MWKQWTPVNCTTETRNQIFFPSDSSGLVTFVPVFQFFVYLFPQTTKVKQNLDVKVFNG